jgi:hypothetical protein
MAPPTYSNGQILNASDCNLWFTPEAAYKTSTTVRNTLTKSIDPDLQVTLAASSIYQVTVAVIYTSAHNLSGTGAGTWGFTWGATVSAAGLGGSVNGIQVHGMIQTAGSSGTFGFSWASDTGPVNCTLGVGSVLTARQVG